MVSDTVQIVWNYSARRQILEVYVTNFVARLAVFPYHRHYYHCKFRNLLYETVSV
jgi:hypothetical protein